MRSIWTRVLQRRRARSAPRHLETRALERDGERVGQGRLRHHAAQLDAQMHDGLRDLRADAADDAVGAHQPGRRHGLEEMLGHQGVDGGYAGDVDDGDAAPGLDDALEQALHHDLRARAVERADEGQREDTLPELDDRRGQLEHLLLLAGDDPLAGSSGRPRWCRGPDGRGRAWPPTSRPRPGRDRARAPGG